MNAEQVHIAAPPTPACMSDRDAWVHYLLMAHNTSKRNGPFNKGVFQTSWSFCRDCTLEHTTRMSRHGKCHPSQFRVIPISKEVICERV